MKRREFLKLGGAGAALLYAAPKAHAYHDTMATWRSFRFTYFVELQGDAATARLWLPMPQFEDTLHQRSMGEVWNGKADKAGFQKVAGDIPVFYAEWRGKGPRSLTASLIVKTADWHPHLEQAGGVTGAPVIAEMQPYLKPSRLLATDGVVRSTAQSVTKSASGALEKARAIYDWVVENTRYDPAIKGMGRGDPKAMLQSGNLVGRSADISGLFVALCRAAGVPARATFGIRMDDSELFKSLGAYGDITREQHCRAEFFLPGAGWVPVDPSDVRKVVAEENLPLADAKVTALRQKLFGSWEMNWCEFNHGEDVVLAKDSGAGALPYFAYPYAEVGRQSKDSLEPASFSYRIESRELVGTGVKF
jgi:transglutaminase-like putative cysteine protease